MEKLDEVRRSHLHDLLDGHCLPCREWGDALQPGAGSGSEGMRDELRFREFLMFTELRIVRRLRGAMQCDSIRLQGRLCEREVKRPCRRSR
jgi:hypothetical protein